MKIALIGYGKMGKEIEKIALNRGHEIVSIIDINNQEDFESDAFKSADVAAKLNVSLRRLNALFEESDRLSAFEFIRQERMRRAALMLGQSTLAVADVALEVGYPNSANFSTEFKKFWGKSPTQLRNESQENLGTLQKIISSKFNRPA